MADLAMKAGMSDLAKDKAERDIRWVGEFADELTVAIALREWDRAVELVEQGIYILFSLLSDLRSSCFFRRSQAINHPSASK